MRQLLAIFACLLMLTKQQSELENLSVGKGFLFSSHRCAHCWVFFSKTFSGFLILSVPKLQNSHLITNPNSASFHLFSSSSISNQSRSQDKCSNPYIKGRRIQKLLINQPSGFEEQHFNISRTSNEKSTKIATKEAHQNSKKEQLQMAHQQLIHISSLSAVSVARLYQHPPYQQNPPAYQELLCIIVLHTASSVSACVHALYQQLLRIDIKWFLF